jgi:hypothetical protein
VAERLRFLLVELPQRHDAPAVDNVAVPNRHAIKVIDPIVRSRAIRGFGDLSFRSWQFRLN